MRAICRGHYYCAHTKYACATVLLRMPDSKRGRITREIIALAGLLKILITWVNKNPNYWCNVYPENNNNNYWCNVYPENSNTNYSREMRSKIIALPGIKGGCDF